MANPAATRPGADSPRRLVIPAMAGPTTNAMPKAAPIIPIARDRASGGVTSASAACATLTVAPDIPATTRETSRAAKLPASPKIR